MDDILYGLAELLAALVGQVLWPLAKDLPPQAWGVLIAVGSVSIVYTIGWNAAVEADYNDDLAKAGARRRARLR